jgi:hypothetical protein
MKIPKLFSKEYIFHPLQRSRIKVVNFNCFGAIAGFIEWHECEH